MEYRKLGESGLKVSELSFGSWVTFVNQLTEKKAMDCMAYAYDQGVNFFDNAEAYASGESEILMGNVLKKLKWNRDTYIVSSKVFWGGELPTQKGLSKKHIHDACHAALKRLKVDYLDLFFCHRPDPHTPTSTVVRSMTQMVRSGRATAWGTSEWSAQQITEAFWIARSEGLEPPQFEQPQYNMLHRDRFENEYFPMFNPPYNIGTTIWSPLRSGFLTGKYLEEIPDDSRATQEGYEWLLEDLEERRRRGEFEVVSKLVDYAENKGCTPAQLALAWCLKNPNVSTILMGATTPAQIEDNMGCIEVARGLGDDDMSELDDILGNKPESWMGPGGVGTRQLKTL